MFYKLKDRVNRVKFNFQARRLLETPPVALNSDLDLHVLSLLQHKDMLMYLAAIKSFARQVPVSQVHVVNDGSLSEKDKRILRAHVPGIAIHGIGSFRRPGLPVGGCWERLVAIAELSRTAYVIQLDADTLTLGPLAEVVAAVRGGHSFAIGTWDDQKIEPMLERAELAKRVLEQGNNHVQVVAEAMFDRLDDASDLRYVRGCAGFSGFPPSDNKLALITTVSSRMSDLLGPTWSNWGSEQVMSNVIVANHGHAAVLPHPVYCDCMKFRESQTVFVHFIGVCRFATDRYIFLTEKVLM